MTKIPPFRARPLNRRSSRLRRLLRRARNRLVNSHTVRLLELGGYRCKRITFHDSWLAEQAATSLRSLRGTKMCPELLAHFEHQVFVEYIEGKPVEAFGESHVPRLVEFFTALHATGSEARDISTLPIQGDLELDLAFLRNVSVLSDECAQDLSRAAGHLAPERLRVGFEYTDPLPRNFVERPNGDLVAIDVESFERDAVQGTGLAKVLARADDAFRECLFAQLRDSGHSELARALPFIELAFLADWMKYAFLKGREKIIDPGRFERFRLGRGADSA